MISPIGCDVVKRWACVLAATALIAVSPTRIALAEPAPTPVIVDMNAAPPKVEAINPPEDGFFGKKLDFHGIPIKGHRDVLDRSLYEVYTRLTRELAHQPGVLANLVAKGAQFHIIGQRQITSDLPEFRELKGKKLNEFGNQDFGGQNIDQRTRGMGGLQTSCGEENLLRLTSDRYHGYDICIHEFSHSIRNNGATQEFRDQIEAQYQRSTGKGRWKGAYAATNADEYFAELSTWYFGAHGDMGMSGAKPGNGPGGLRLYDPEGYKLLDDFYSGRIKIPGPTGGG